MDTKRLVATSKFDQLVLATVDNVPSFLSLRILATRGPIVTLIIGQLLPRFWPVLEPPLD
jgi:hypothetical protein